MIPSYYQVITALFPFCSRIISGSLLVILCSSFGWEQRKMGGEMGVKPGWYLISSFWFWKQGGNNSSILRDWEQKSFSPFRRWDCWGASRSCMCRLVKKRDLTLLPSLFFTDCLLFYFSFGTKVMSTTSAPLNNCCANFWMSFGVTLLMMSS